MTATKETTRENLVDRLRGKYVVPVDDGAGLLDGKDTFEQQYEVGPIQKMAADEIETLRAIEAAAREYLKAEDELTHNSEDGWESLHKATKRIHLARLLSLRNLLQEDGK